MLHYTLITTKGQQSNFNNYSKKHPDIGFNFPDVMYKHAFKSVFLTVNNVQGPPGQKGDQGATEIIDYNGNIQEALQVRQVVTYFHSFLSLLLPKRPSSSMTQ